MKAFVWQEGNSYLHRLNPLTKLALTVPVVAIVSTAFEPWTPLSIALLALAATYLLGQVPAWSLIRPMGLALILGLGMFWTSAVFYAGEGSLTSPIVGCIGPICVTSAGLVFGAAMGARLLAVFAASMLFVLTTDPIEFVLALIHQGRMPVRLGYAVFAAYRFVPLLQEEFGNIRAAHQMRGAAGEHVMGRVREFFGYAIPLLAIAVRRGERLALSMDARAFGAQPDRTFFRVTSWSTHDLVFAIGAATVLVGVLLARIPLGI